jgi:hypothetical protein
MFGKIAEFKITTNLGKKENGGGGEFKYDIFDIL